MGDVVPADVLPHKNKSRYLFVLQAQRGFPLFLVIYGWKFSCSTPGYIRLRSNRSWGQGGILAIATASGHW